MIVVDTNVLYALADRQDKHHAGCTEWFRGNDEVLLVPRILKGEPTRRIEVRLDTDRDEHIADLLRRLAGRD